MIDEFELDKNDENYQNHIDWQIWANSIFYYDKESKSCYVNKNIDREYSISDLMFDLKIHHFSKFKLIIMANVSDISNLDFSDCENISAIIVDKNNKYFESYNGSLYLKNLSILLTFIPDKLFKQDRTIIINDNVQYIHERAFDSIYIDNTDEYIFKLPNNLRKLQDKILTTIKNLKIIINDNIEYISPDCFIADNILFQGENKNFYCINGELFKKCDHSKYIFYFNRILNIKTIYELLKSNLSRSVISKIVVYLDLLYDYSLKQNIVNSLTNYNFDKTINLKEFDEFKVFLNACKGMVVSNDKTLIRYYGTCEDFYIDNKYLKIFDWAFYNNFYIKKIIITNKNISNLKNLVFNCVNLEDIYLSDTIIRIESNFVVHENNIKEIHINKTSNLKAILRQDYLFNLKNIFIPKNLELLKLSPIIDFNTYFIVDDNNFNFAAYNGCLFDKIKNQYIHLFRDKINNVTLFDYNCNEINSNILKSCKNIESIIFKSSNMFKINGPIASAGNKNLTTLVFVGKNFNFNNDIFKRLGNLKYILFDNLDLAYKVYNDIINLKYRNKIYCCSVNIKSNKFYIFNNQKYYSLNLYYTKSVKEIDSELQVFDLLKRTPTISKEHIIEKLKLSENAVNKIIKKLRMDGKIESYIQESPVQTKILNCLSNGGLQRKEIVKITGLPVSSIETALTKLRKKNLIDNIRGVWVLK